jgi:hypothetical protein
VTGPAPRGAFVAAAWLAFFTASAWAFAAGQIPAAFQRAREALTYARIPVLLPTVFAEAHLSDPRRTFVRATAQAHHYALQINDADDCNGANVCSEGTFAASDAAYRATLNKNEALEDSVFNGGRRVKLAGGLVGYFWDQVSGASGGGNSYLHFTSDGVRYSIVTRINTQTELVKIANSAIQNGVISRQALTPPPAGER